MEFGKQSGRLQAANLRLMRLVALNAALDLEAAGLAATHLRRYADGLNIAAEMSAPFDHPSVRKSPISGKDAGHG